MQNNTGWPKKMPPIKLFVKSTNVSISNQSLVHLVSSLCMIIPQSFKLVSLIAVVWDNFEKNCPKPVFMKNHCQNALLLMSLNHKLAFFSAGSAWNCLLLLWFCQSDSKGLRKAVIPNFKHFCRRSIQSFDASLSGIDRLIGVFLMKTGFWQNFSKLIHRKTSEATSLKLGEMIMHRLETTTTKNTFDICITVDFMNNYVGGIFFGSPCIMTSSS